MWRGEAQAVWAANNPQALHVLELRLSYSELYGVRARAWTGGPDVGMWWSTPYFVSAVEKVGLVSSGNSPSKREKSQGAVSVLNSVVVRKTLCVQGRETQSSASTRWQFQFTQKKCAPSRGLKSPSTETQFRAALAESLYLASVSSLQRWPTFPTLNVSQRGRQDANLCTRVAKETPPWQWCRGDCSYGRCSRRLLSGPPRFLPC